MTMHRFANHIEGDPPVSTGFTVYRSMVQRCRWTQGSIFLELFGPEIDGGINVQSATDALEAIQSAARRGPAADNDAMDNAITVLRDHLRRTANTALELAEKAAAR